MAWRIAGSYAASCSCNLICPCPVDGPPTAPDGECKGFIVFGVKEGNLDDTDLSGVNFALYNFFPSNLTAGNWKVGIVIDSEASDEQADALERICRARPAARSAISPTSTASISGPSATPSRCRTATGQPPRSAARAR